MGDWEGQKPKKKLPGKFAYSSVSARRFGSRLTATTRCRLGRLKPFTELNSGCTAASVHTAPPLRRSAHAVVQVRSTQPLALAPPAGWLGLPVWGHDPMITKGP